MIDLSLYVVLNLSGNCYLTGLIEIEVINLAESII